MLAALSPRMDERPVIVLLTPGIFNSAYFEHSYLAQQTGAQLVQGTDLLVGSDDVVYMKTIAGLRRVDVIYRRIDDDFLDPDVFRSDSVLGVPGLMRAWRQGQRGHRQRAGRGRGRRQGGLHLSCRRSSSTTWTEDPILPNVPSYLCCRRQEREYVLANLDKLVVKPANESGGYGMLIGPQATPEARKQCAAARAADPRSYMAQPTLQLSTAPTWSATSIAPRHLDMRPFVLQSRGLYVTTGGLTRVAHARGFAGGEFLAGRRQQGHLDRGGAILMLSRAAESLYWMARYLERAENTARLINATQQVLLDLPRAPPSAGTTLTSVVGLDKLFQQSYRGAGRNQRGGFPDGIAAQSGLHPVLRPLRARELPHHARRAAARAVGARQLPCTWRPPRHRRPRIGRKDRRQMLEELICDRQSVSGVLADCMSHDVAYQFMRPGRAHRARRHDHAHPRHQCRRPAAAEPGQRRRRSLALLWVGVLNSLSAFQMYRRHAQRGSRWRHHRRARGAISSISDPHFPRSVVYCLDAIETHLAELPHNVEPLRALRAGAPAHDRMSAEELAPAQRHEFLDAMQERPRAHP